MKRQLTLEIDSCSSCPNLVCIDGFASHHYSCSIINQQTGLNYGYNADEIEKELTNWFENVCILDRAR